MAYARHRGASENPMIGNKPSNSLLGLSGLMLLHGVKFCFRLVVKGLHAIFDKVGFLS